MNTQQEEAWTKINDTFGDYLHKLSQAADLQVEELDTLLVQQNSILDQISSYFKLYGLKDDELEFIKSQYAKGQELFITAERRISDKKSEIIQAAESHTKYIHAQSHNE